MRFFFTLSVLLPLVSFELWSGTIDSPPVDVSKDTSQLLNQQDKLLFTVSEYSYEANAAMRGLSALPTHITFEFISEQEAVPGDFTAWLESRDGSVEIEFPSTFSWLPGQFQSSGYTGPVSVLYGSTDLSSTMAAELFGTTSAVLVLENEGGEADVGLPPYTLGQDLSVSFSSSGFGVSGPVTGVRYQDPPAGVPEPCYGRVLAVLGIVSWPVIQGAKRISRRRIQ